MEKVGKKELNFRGKKITKMVYHEALGSDIVKINNVWLRIDGNNITDKYIEYSKKLYILGLPDKNDLKKLGLE